MKPLSKILKIATKYLTAFVTNDNKEKPKTTCMFVALNRAYKDGKISAEEHNLGSSFVREHIFEFRVGHCAYLDLAIFHTMGWGVGYHYSHDDILFLVWSAIIDKLEHDELLDVDKRPRIFHPRKLSIILKIASLYHVSFGSDKNDKSSFMCNCIKSAYKNNEITFLEKFFALRFIHKHINKDFNIKSGIFTLHCLIRAQFNIQYDKNDLMILVWSAIIDKLEHDGN